MRRSRASRPATVPSLDDMRSAIATYELAKGDWKVAGERAAHSKKKAFRIAYDKAADAVADAEDALLEAIESFRAEEPPDAVEQSASLDGQPWCSMLIDGVVWASMFYENGRMLVRIEMDAVVSLNQDAVPA